MNKKGFTLVELITTFALTAVIVVLLINVVLVIKNVYSKTSVKTELYINQSNLSNALNSKINSGNLESYEGCNDTEFCYVFNFVDGTSSKLTVTENKIKFDNYTYNLDKNTKVENPSLTKEYVDLSDTSNDDNFFVLNIPITSQLYPNIDFGINLIYSNDVKLLCSFVSGNINTIGSEVKCGTEHFYIINNDGTNIEMLSKYNLTLSTTNPMQDTTGSTNPVAFSSIAYWYDFSNGSDGSYIEEFANYASEGRSYPYVYDSRSNLYLYVEAYKEVLEGMGVNVIEAKLLSYEQAIDLGCSSNSCTSAPTWVRSSTYWLGSANAYYDVWYVGSGGGYTYDYYDGSEDTVGIRPIITISKDFVSD